jgi:hypothetical protein
MELDLQRIDVKMLAEAPADLSLDPFLAIFSRWRKQQDQSDWIDLADYAHMPKGAGIMLIGKQGSFSVNLDDPGIGLLYSGRKDFDGPPEGRVLEAFRRCLRLTKPLLAEPDYPQQLKLLPGSWELFINDRLNFPNSDETDQLLHGAIESALNTLFGRDRYSTRRENDPQRRYAFSVRAQGGDIDTLADKAKAVAP